MEKIPQEYNQGKLQKIIEYLESKVARTDKKADRAIQDLSLDLETKLGGLEKKLTEKIAGKDEMGFPASVLPKPQNLVVHDLGVFGFARVDPFYQWKYFGRVRGYEFYGSSNSGFTPHSSAYTQTGTHYGGTADQYLNTEDTSTPANTFVLTGGLLGKTIENVTSGESGTIYNYRPIKPKYQIRAYKTLSPLAWLTWDDGDEWRIKEYPSNKLFSIGSQAMFTKRLGNFYVKARTFGRGNSYSDFTSEATSVGTDDFDTPEIVMPVHTKTSAGVACGETCTMGEKESSNWGFPVCPVHGVVSWSEIMSGTREVDHFVFFGVEFCTVELVWNAIETTRKGVWYDVARGTTDTTDEEIE